MRHDLISDALSIINNAEAVGKEICVVPASKFVEEVLKVIKNAGYIIDYSYNDKENKFQINLGGRINKIKAVRPRFSVHKNEYDKWEVRYLPARNMGVLIISTSGGIMNQKEAAEKGVGGKLVAYIY